MEEKINNSKRHVFWFVFGDIKMTSGIQYLCYKGFHSQPSLFFILYVLFKRTAIRHMWLNGI